VTPFTELLTQNASNAWLFIPSAILLGALHGLEPGHSKTMMAAFIVAVRGTVLQAVLLGLAATISHTAVVWGVALGGMYLWPDMNAETTEPYFQLISAILIIGIALWMLWRTWQDNQRSKQETSGDHHAHEHDHAHAHHHNHDNDLRRIDTGHGMMLVEVFETNVPPRWRLRAEGDQHWSAHAIQLETERPDGTRQQFSFQKRDGYLESIEEIPEPHEFMARLTLGHGNHSHSYDIAFIENNRGHDSMHEELRGLESSTGGYRNAHELAHANDIRRRFSNQTATTKQIILFGLTGGLIPCPAAITILLLCLQLKRIALGATMVLCFSVGLALTLVTVGVAAAMSVRYATQHTAWFGKFVRHAPYFSSGLILLVGLLLGFHGWEQLAMR
jgi:nickel/cobalt exporter